MEKKQIITGKQMECTIAMFLFGSALVANASNKAKQDSWIPIIVGSIIALPMMVLYCSIIKKYPGKTIFDILIIVFGKIIGKILCVLYIWYTIHLGTLILSIFSEFIHMENIEKTPQIVIVVFLILLGIWSATIGVQNIGRVSKSTFPILVIFVLLTVILSVKDMNFSNIKPLISTDVKTLASSSFGMFSIPFGETIVCMSLFPWVKSKSSPTKMCVKSVVICSLILFISNLRNLLLLGAPLNEQYYFRSYHAVSIISIGDFFTRIEVLIGANLLLAGFTKICVCILVSSMGLARLFDLNKSKAMVAPCALVMVTLTTMIHTNTLEMFKWLDIYPIYAAPFQVILPIIILVAIQIKTRKKKNAALPKPESMGSLH